MLHVHYLASVVHFRGRSHIGQQDTNWPVRCFLLEFSEHWTHMCQSTAAQWNSRHTSTSNASHSQCDKWKMPSLTSLSHKSCFKFSVVSAHKQIQWPSLSLVSCHLPEVLSLQVGRAAAFQATAQAQGCAWQTEQRSWGGAVPGGTTAAFGLLGWPQTAAPIHRLGSPASGITWRQFCCRCISVNREPFYQMLHI